MPTYLRYELMVGLLLAQIMCGPCTCKESPSLWYIVCTAQFQLHSHTLVHKYVWLNSIYVQALDSVLMSLKCVCTEYS